MSRALLPDAAAATAALLLVFFGVMFLVASAQKVVLGSDFILLLERHAVLPRPFRGAVVSSLPLLEGVAGLFLSSMYAPEASFSGLLLLLLAFSLYRWVVHSRGVTKGCGCFGASEYGVSSRAEVAAGLVYVLLALAGAVIVRGAAPLPELFHWVGLFGGMTLGLLLYRGAFRERRLRCRLKADFRQHRGAGSS